MVVQKFEEQNKQFKVDLALKFPRSQSKNTHERSHNLQDLNDLLLGGLGGVYAWAQGAILSRWFYCYGSYNVSV